MKKMKLINSENVHQIFSSIDNVLLDCDGVIWGGQSQDEILNNAITGIQKLQKIKKKVFLLTNNTSRTQESFKEKCLAMNINIDEDSAVCAPYILAQYLKNIKFKKKLYIIGSVGLAEELQKSGFRCEGPKVETMNLKEVYKAVEKDEIDLDPEVGAVAVGIDYDFNYAKLVKANCYLSNPECLLLAANVDERYPVLNTNVYLPATGTLVRAIETAAGRKATVVGKPSTLMFEVLSKKHKLVPERTLMIGDTLYTDILFGNKCGLQTALVLTGVSSLEDVKKLEVNEENDKDTSLMIPNFYSPSLGDICSFIEKN